MIENNIPQQPQKPPENNETSDSEKIENEITEIKENKSEEKHEEVDAHDLSKQIEVQNENDQKKIEEILGKINSVNWKEFWKKEGLNSPARKEVFPDGEDKEVSDEEVVDALNKYFEKQGSNSFNMTGIDSEEFPEIIDKDIREICVKLNKLPFLKTKEGCGGHESDKSGEVSNVGYSEPYLIFYAEENNPEFKKFAEDFDKELHQLRNSKIPGIENIIIEADQWPASEEEIMEHRIKMHILPTKEWCQNNNKNYIQKPENPGFFDETRQSRKEWEKERNNFQSQMEKFNQEFGEYFRSDEVKKLRDEFFKAFEYDKYTAKAYVEENLGDFENAEIKKMSELPYWNKINRFLADKKLADSEVIVVDDNEKWKSIYGSNDSKSSHKPMAIILKKEIFEDENISDENLSWLIHEIGHTEFYKKLGGKLDEYMEEYHAKGEYTNSEMERDAFRLQFEFLKSMGKTKAECLDFVEKYLNKSFAENDKVAKKKELEQIKEYMDDVL